ncbi:DUF2782 domain-containing protein [Niveibacterium sp. 24ML]|uniref:DUF2782 domain-containing protein n=1 Tax=Niveibacterium sp. 24ML TaxID=2985512 RepID=UPI0022722715|nr:DUF2782 domain-containing protein [Niveibacterium sp. 24ML]MCX9154713.1 DUF2782 domain-containing protein [Niveibacterium sp. 24ML]
MLRPIHTLIAIALLVSGNAFAQTPPKLEPIPEPPPPPPGVVDASEEPEINVSTRGEDKIEEYRIKGKLYMIKVTPKVGQPYYLVDQKGDGVFAPTGEGQQNLSVPMWLIKSW